MPQLTAILDEVFGAQPMAHWHEVFDGVHVTFGAVRGPQEVINDPQLRANDIVVPLEGAGGKLPHDQQPHPGAWRRQSSGASAPGTWRAQRGDSQQLGFNANEIDGLHASGAVPKAKERAA